MGWDGPMLTDSGGFQIFSLGHGSVAEEIKGNRNERIPPLLVKLEEAGATFRSPYDGSYPHLTPERTIAVQSKLGAAMIAVLDECPPFHVDRAAERSEGKEGGSTGR